MTITVKGGTVVSATALGRADLRIEGETIAEIGDLEPDGEVVDATGLLVLPGMVDTHVHLMDPGPTDREDFPTGTSAAAARGVTTVVEHTHAHPIRSVSEFDDKRHYLQGRSNVDYGLAAHVWPDHIGDITELAAAGISFFKIFTCTTHGVPGLDPFQLREALIAIAGAGIGCLIHNEDESLTTSTERRLREEGRSDPGLLSEWRSREAEMVAVASSAALVLSTGAAATFAHVSSPPVLDVIDAFRNLGADIVAEACPQYFTMEEAEVESFGALRKFTPPARIRRAEDRVAMWEAVRTGRFHHFSTDHAPSTVAQKTGTGFWDAPFGLPGLDTTLPFLLDAALEGEIALTDLVRLYSTAPADRYRLPKGRLAPGSDADLVLVDPEANWQVEDGDIISKAGWTPLAGRSFRGGVVSTYLRGREIARDGRCHHSLSGNFVRPR